MTYKHSLLIFKIFNDAKQSMKWVKLNFQQTYNVRTALYKYIMTENSKGARTTVSTDLQCLAEKLA
jgi:hypothetical protein